VLLTGPARNQSPVLRYSILSQLYLRHLAEIRKKKRRDIRVIEIGSWVGASTCIWSYIGQISVNLGYLDSVEVIAIDPLEPYLGYIHREDHYKAMESALEQKTVEQSFYDNIRKFAYAPNVRLVKLPSDEALPHFASKSVDILYVDGSHFYENVKRDLIHSKRICKNGGLLICDDVEKLKVDDYELHLQALSKRIDYLNGYHPGVTQAVKDVFPFSGTSDISGMYAKKKYSFFFEL